MFEWYSSGVFNERWNNFRMVSETVEQLQKHVSIIYGLAWCILYIVPLHKGKGDKYERRNSRGIIIIIIKIILLKQDYKIQLAIIKHR